LTHAIKRWVKMGHDIESGEEIQEAIKDLAGTHVANIMPNCEEFLIGNGLGQMKERMQNEHVFRKPEPMLSEHTTPTKSWTMPTP
ncbi:21580_t:CDS:2, partial [Gigaspora rosea]